MSTTGVITATGTKGLLQYLKTYQPALYAAANPKLLAYAKAQNGAAAAQVASSGPGASMGRLSAIGRCGNIGELFAPNISENFVATPLSATSVTTDPSSGLDVDSLATIDAGPVIVTAPPDLVVTGDSSATDSASVASSGATSSGFASIISSIAKGIGTATLTAAQVSANNTLLATNLARAQQGLPPLTATTTAGGLTTLGSSSTLLLLGGALLIGALVLGNKK
jgi:hypothetical protein